MPIKTPICDFGQKAKSFELKSTNNEIIKLNDVQGSNGTLVMFICNHCPYNKAIIKDIVNDKTHVKGSMSIKGKNNSFKNPILKWKYESICK